MKKFVLKLSFCVVIIACIIIFLNINVTTRQGINYQVHTIKVPLYLKVVDFIDRHFNYKQLVKQIIKDAKSDEERAVKIFEWTCENIRENPESLPVIDDHVWHIIVRGYGVGDQSQDVFTTLCNYAGLDAFFSWVYTQEQTRKIPLSFVKIEGKCCIFDPYRGVYFKDAKGKIADVETIKSKNVRLIKTKDKEPDIDYAIYLNDSPSIKEIGLTRANIQSPIKRLIYEVKKWLKKKRTS